LQRDKTDQVDAFLEQFRARLLLWLESKPSGKASLEFVVNEGGIRGVPRITVTEDL